VLQPQHLRASESQSRNQGGLSSIAFALRDSDVAMQWRKMTILTMNEDIHLFLIDRN